MLDIKNLVDLVEKESTLIHLDKIVNKPENWYYYCLSAYCKLASIKHVLELGTYTGLSSYALGTFAKTVTSVDIDNKIDPSIFCTATDSVTGKSVVLNKLSNIHFIKLGCPEQVLLFNPTIHDFIYIDIDHESYLEILLHRKLCRDHYKGFVFYDDVELPAMKPFWDYIETNIDQKNYIKTKWHGTSGFGIVKY